MLATSLYPLFIILSSCLRGKGAVCKTVIRVFESPTGLQIQVNEMSEKTRIKRCRRCKTELVIVGFERKLITRGKDKGLSIVRDFLGCPNKECQKDV